MKRLNEFFSLFEYPSEAVDFFIRAENKLSENAKANELLSALVSSYETSDSFDIDTLNADIKKASNISGISDKALLFIVYANMTFHMRELYKKSSIDDRIWRDSVCDLGFKNRECHDVYGEWGLFTDWFQYFLKLRLFALGRLQYQADPYNITDEPIVRYGSELIPHKTTAISIHIPSDGKLLLPDVIDSLKRAYDFYKDLRVDGKLLFQCSSWLLYPKMLEFIDDDSNLAKFMGCFEILGSGTDPNFGNCWRIFGRDYSEGSKALVRNTKLQKQYAEWLDKGNLPGFGKGIIIFDGEKILR